VRKEDKFWYIGGDPGLGTNLYSALRSSSGMQKKKVGKKKNRKVKRGIAWDGVSRNRYVTIS